MYDQIANFTKGAGGRSPAKQVINRLVWITKFKPQNSAGHAMFRTLLDTKLLATGFLNRRYQLYKEVSAKAV